MNHPNWKNGRIVQPDGYILVWTKTRTYTLEHRLVMSKHLKRDLLPSEIVHHINGIRDDNRIENLQIMTSSEHSRHHRLTENRSTRFAICHPDRKHLALDMCEECYEAGRSRVWQLANPEKVKETKKIWHKKTYDPTIAKEKNDKWLAENPEKAKECRKKTYDKYAEDRRERSRLWREQNREKSREYSRLYQAKKKVEKEAKDKND